MTFTHLRVQYLTTGGKIGSILQRRKVKWHVDIVAFVTETFRPPNRTLSHYLTAFSMTSDWKFEEETEAEGQILKVFTQQCDKDLAKAKIQNVRLSLQIYYFSQYDKEAAGGWKIQIFDSVAKI